MNMKKLMAGVAASALAVTSLATVGVFAADDVREFNFTSEKNSVTFNYDKTITYKEAVAVSDVFGSTYGDVKIQFTVPGYGAKDGYSLGWLAGEMTKYFGDSYLRNAGATITVTGTRTVNDKTENVTVKATTANTKYLPPSYSGTAVAPFFTLRFEGDGANKVLQDSDLDLTRIEEIKSINIKASFTVDTGALKVNPDGVWFNVKPIITAGTAAENLTAGATANVDDMTQYWTPATAKSEVDGSKRPQINVGDIYTFEGDVAWGQYTFLPSGQGATGGVPAYSLGNNLLRWTNDNIIQNKGAKLRITFMTPSAAQDALSQGNVQTYPTTPGAGNVLEPGTEAGSDATTKDIMIGVNLPNTTKLQQATNIVNYVAEFDWDTLVQNSVSTISGNVDSIAIRVNDDSKNVKDTFGSTLTIEKIEVVIPDQSTVPGANNDKVISLTAGEPDANVKVIGTIGTIYGNGAQDLTVVANVTATSVSYTLKLTDANGNYVQPAGEVTLQMSIPSKVTKVTSDKVKHTCNDGTVEELTIENYATCMTDGYVVVKTSKFSSFEFEVETEEDQVQTEATTTEAPVTEATEAPSANNGNANPGTGVALAVIPAIVAAAGVVISKKRG